METKGVKTFALANVTNISRLSVKKKKKAEDQVLPQDRKEAEEWFNRAELSEGLCKRGRGNMIT